MRKADKIKLLYIASVSLLAFMIGCVDTTIQNIPNSIDYRSQVSVVNLTPGGGTASFNFYENTPKIITSSTGGDSIAQNIDYSKSVLSGSLALGGVQAYTDIPAGGKGIIATYSGFPGVKDTFKLATETDYKMRIFLVGDGTGTGVEYQKSAERYIWQTPSSSDGASIFPSGSGWIRLFNGSPDAGTVTAIKVKGGSVDSTLSVTAAYKGGTKYFQFAAGTYTFSVWAGTDSLAGFSQALSSKGRYTTVIYDMKASLKNKVLTDD